MFATLPLAAWLALAPAAPAAPSTLPPTARADWRRDGVDERVKLALIARGWRLEDDGRALDPKTKAPATKADLVKAVRDLRESARRAALERVHLLLVSGKSLENGDRDVVASLSADLPPALVAAVFDPKSDPAKLKAMANAGLREAAAYFDGNRTLADRRAAIWPVSVGAASKSVALPYFDAKEKTVGESLREAAAAAIGRDPFGKTILARLTGLPPMLVSDIAGAPVAVYDFRRRAIVINRETLLDSIVEDGPVADSSALRNSLSSRQALLDYVAAHPEAADAFAAKNDVIIVHELTHAWQDRRDPVLRDIARENLPDAQLLEYEEEAFMWQTLFLHSRLKNDPASVRDDDALTTYAMMMHSRISWWKQTEADYRRSSPALALNAEDIAAIQKRRLDAARTRQARTREQLRDKALDMAALTFAGRQFNATAAASKARLTALTKEIDAAAPQRYRRLAIYYLGQALREPRATDRAIKLQKAELQAKASGDKDLMEKVRKAKEARP